MNAPTKADIFDKLDLFDIIESQRLKEYVAPPKVSVSLSDEIRELIKAEIGSAIKAAVADAVKRIKPHTIETKTIERVLQKSIPTPEKIIIREKLDDDEFMRRVDKKIKKALDEEMVFIPAPPIIASMSGQSGKVLSTDGSQTRWITASSGGGSSSDTYTVSNVTTDRNYDADNTSLDEVADVLGSLIASLQGAGIIH